MRDEVIARAPILRRTKTVGTVLAMNVKPAGASGSMRLEQFRRVAAGMFMDRKADVERTIEIWAVHGLLSLMIAQFGSARGETAKTSKR
jgi:hypothetical protein